MSKSPLVMDAKYFYLALFLATALAFLGSYLLSFFGVYFVVFHLHRNKQFTNKWIEKQAKHQGLKVCYVNIGGEDNGRGKKT